MQTKSLDRRPRAPRALALAALALTALALATRPLAAQRDTAYVTGTVTSTAGLPLARATVSVVGGARFTITDSAGRYRIGGLQAGTIVLRARLLGFRAEERRVVVRPEGTAGVAFRLEDMPLSLAPVRTQAALTERERFESVPEVGVMVIAGGVAKTLPAVGESDVMRTVQLLPGVVARSDFSAGLNVRGGEADQNLVLLDGIPIYNPFHLGGLFGTFMESTVGDVRLLAGGFPASYGGRLSSVLEVTSAEEARAGVHGEVSVSMLAASTALGGALADGRTSWNVAVRRTYADAVAGTLVDRDFPYHFEDAQAHVTHALPNGGSLSFTAYHGLDALRENLYERRDTLGTDGDYDFDWGNDAAGVTFSLPFGQGSTLVQRASITRFHTTLDLGEGSFVRRNTVQELRLAGSITQQIASHLLSVGYEASRHRVSYREESPQLTAQLQRFEQKPVAISAFADDVWKLGERVVLRPGVRVERVSTANWTGVSPRLAARYFVNDDLAITGAVGRHAQWVHSLHDEDVPLRLFDFWVGSDSTIPVTMANHAVLGAERWLTPSRFLRVEGFFKDYDPLVEPDPANDRAVEGDEFRPIAGRSYGVDVYLRQVETGRLSGWVAYTFTKNERDFEGTPFVPAQDRQHNLNVVGSYRLPRGWIMGARFGYGSALPYTPLDAQIVRREYEGRGGRWESGTIDRDVQPLGGARNSARFPAFHRLDLSVQRVYQKGDAILTPFLSVVNAYNRQNVYAYDVDFENAPPSRKSISQLPILPTIGLTVEF